MRTTRLAVLAVFAPLLTCAAFAAAKKPAPPPPVTPPRQEPVVSFRYDAKDAKDDKPAGWALAVYKDRRVDFITRPEAHVTQLWWEQERLEAFNRFLDEIGLPAEGKVTLQDPKQVSMLREKIEQWVVEPARRREREEQDKRRKQGEEAAKDRRKRREREGPVAAR